MKKLSACGCVVLVLAGMASADTYYVATTGNDTTGDGSSGTPWATPQKAVDTLAGGTHTINVAAGTYGTGLTTVLEFTGSHDASVFTIVGSGVVNFAPTGAAYRACRVNATMTSGTLTFQSIVFDLTGSSQTSNTAAFDVRATGVTVNCEECSFLNYTGLTASDSCRAARLLLADPTSGTTNTNVVTFTDCTFEGASTCLDLENAGHVVVDGGSMKWNYAAAQPAAVAVTINTRYTLGSLQMDGVDLDYQGTTNQSFVFGIYNDQALQEWCEMVRLSNLTGTSGDLIRLATRCRRCVINGCTLTLTEDPASDTTSRYMYLGLATGATPPANTTNSYPFEQCEVRGNTLTYPDSQANHLMFMGVGTEGSKILDNTFRVTHGTPTGDFGVILKGINCTISGNKIYAPRYGLYVAGGQRSVIQNNTVVVSETVAFGLDVHQEADANDTIGLPLSNIIRHNIFDGGPGTAVSIGITAGTWYRTSDAWSNLLDYNVLWSTGTDLAVLDDTTVTVAGGLSELLAGWATYIGSGAGLRTIGADNDAHSIVGDPLLVDPAAGDFTLKPASPAFAAAADGTSIGAWQVRGIPVRVGTSGGF